jgi:hypothetical protein
MIFQGAEFTVWEHLEIMKSSGQNNGNTWEVRKRYIDDSIIAATIMAVALIATIIF